ncbi:MAG: tetratricopeptide repeat protein, partial [candidate division Zixibacteria bacterium]|nr:tetratricopeptide repeat protein [candidate division Zixibacteria bacterium]
MTEMDKKRFLELLHSYELGIAISDDEIKELELFLIENDEFLDELKQFRPVIRQLQENSEIRETISELASSKGSKSSETHMSKFGFKKIIARFAPVLGVLIIALILVLKPWKIEISSTDEAFAVENRLAILFFENIGDRSDSAGTAAIIRNLLITDLSESDYFRVVSRQRIQDAKNSLGISDEQKIDRNSASQIANEISPEWLLTGSIIQNQSQFIITGELVDVSSGNIIGSQRIIGKPNEDIFSMTDRMSKLVKDDLPLPDGAGQEFDRQVSDITTKSPKAYQLYLKGVENYNKFYNEEARNYFWSALQYDSTLAMAHYYMSRIQYGNNAKGFIKQAMKYSEHAGRTDRQFIKSQMAFLSGDFKKAIGELTPLLRFYPDDKTIYRRIASFYRQLEKLDSAVFYDKEALKIDPKFGEVLNHLAYVYEDLGENKKAIETIDKYIVLNPNEANPYDSKGELYRQMGRDDLALKSFRDAIKIKPDYGPSLRSLARLYLSAGDFDQAENCFKKLSTLHDFFFQRMGRFGKASIYQLKGQFRKAIDELDLIADGKYDDSTIHWNESINVFAYFMKSKILAELRDYSGALESFDNYSTMFKTVLPNEKLHSEYYYAYLLQCNGDTNKANQFIKTLKETSTDAGGETRDYLMASGLDNFARGNYEKALDYFDKDVKQEDRFYSSYMLGRCLIKTGQFEKAIEILENQKHVYSSWLYFSDIWDIKMQYHLGIAYEASGKNK